MKTPQYLAWNLTHVGHYLTPSHKVNIITDGGKYMIKFVDRLISISTRIQTLIDSVRLCRVWVIYTDGSSDCVYYWNTGAITLPEGLE